MLLTHQDESENETIDQLRRRQKWETNNYMCKGHILNAIRHCSIYTTAGKSARELYKNWRQGT